MGYEKFSNSAKSGYNEGTIRSDLRYLVVSVTAEVASSSLVVPAILSKALRRISLKPLGARKGRVSRLSCALLGDPELPIQQRVLLHPHRKKRLATSPPPALHASRALLPACKRPTLRGTTNAAAAPASP